MELEHVLTKLVGDRRHERDLERSSGDHDLIRPVGAAVHLEELHVLATPD